MSNHQVVLLFGGPSSERRVSVASARHVSSALPHAGLMFISPDEQVFKVEAPDLAGHENPFTVDFNPKAKASYKTLSDALDSDEARGKIFFLCFHGGPGEDGTYQREFEKRGIGFTGSGSKASALAMDKASAKEVAKSAGVRVAEGHIILAAGLGNSATVLQQLFKQHGPLIAKPLGGGSTLGVHFIRREEDVAQAAAELSKSAAEDYLVETLLIGRELTVGVADIFGDLRPLPPSEVLLEKGREFDYEGKYLGKGTQEITPASIPNALRDLVQSLTVKVHRALGCVGYSRTDFIVVGDTPYFLETNTLPGLTGASFLPQQLEAAGIPMRDFLDSQIALAALRQAS